MLLPKCYFVLEFPLKNKLVYFFLIQSHSDVQDLGIILPDPLKNVIHVTSSPILDNIHVLCNYRCTVLTVYISIGSLLLLCYHLNNTLSSAYSMPGLLYPTLVNTIQYSLHKPA